MDVKDIKSKLEFYKGEILSLGRSLWLWWKG